MAEHVPITGPKALDGAVDYRIYIVVSGTSSEGPFGNMFQNSNVSCSRAPEVRMTANWFVGFPIDLGAYHERLEPAPRGVRLFASSDTHLTVAFFGPVTEAQARDAFARCPEPGLRSTELVFTHIELL